MTCFKLIENSPDVVIEVLEYKNVISDKQTSWCVHVDDIVGVFIVLLVMCLGSGLNWRLIVIFEIGRHLYNLHFVELSNLEYS